MAGGMALRGVAAGRVGGGVFVGGSGSFAMARVTLKPHSPSTWWEGDTFWGPTRPLGGPLQNGG
ncbi:hypothetical protein ADK64_11215, partial [Streptomyces sp. MMG1121]